MMTPVIRRAAGTTAALALIFTAGAATVPAQATSFSYQGKLTDAGSAANGLFDFEFRLFDAPVGGSPTSATLSHGDVPVSNGIFTVTLDFGPGAFTGPPRFLEVAVRSGASSGGFTHLAPLHPLTSAPYSIRSLQAAVADSAAAADTLSAACAGCVTNASIADVAGSKITGPVPVAAIPPGSGSYIQNGTVLQGAANFNIAGSGTAAGTLTAGDFNYLKAQTSYYAVSDAAFTARDGVPVSKTAGLGGAYPTASTTFGLVAPVNLPHGATITNVRFVYIDNSTSALSLTLFAHSISSGFYSNIAMHNSTVQTSVVQSINVAASWVVDSSAHSLVITAFPTGGWSDSAMQVRGVLITYTMPRPAR